LLIKQSFFNADLVLNSVKNSTCAINICSNSVKIRND
jgi:hypothetical protein